jgi:hypothetical protein
MTDLLRSVLAQVEQLPPEEQDAIAVVLRRELEEREWATITSTPASSQRFLARLAAEARAEDAAGETQESGDRW